MEALILSCGTGGGHNAAGAAVREELLRRGWGAEMLDPYSLKSDRTARTISTAYVRLVQTTPAAFGAAYQIGNLYRRLPVRSPIYQLNAAMVDTMERYLTQHHYDAVVMPHLFPAEIMTHLKRRGFPVPKTFFVATDYSCIPFTEETRCDGYIAPARELVGDFVRRGIPEERVHPLGIPVSAKFNHRATPAQARQALGLNPEGRYILVAGGSMGAGKLTGVVQVLREEFAGQGTEIIVICGSNRALYKALSGQEGVIPLEYTDRMAEYMRASDLVLSKPGGLSSTEAAVTGTALIHITPIPGCESLNMRFFEEQGMSLAVHAPQRELAAACRKLLAPGAAQAMAQAQRRVINPNAAADICALMERMVEG